MTDETPYDTRFDADDAEGNLRTTPLLHSSKGGEIPFLVHSTRKGLQSCVIDSILLNGLYAGGLDQKKSNVYFSAMDWRKEYRSEWEGRDFEAAWRCEESIPWPYWPRGSDDCVVIVDVDRLIDAGLSGYQTASAAVLTEANEMVPAHCITFAFCTVTGAVLYSDTNLH